MSKCWGTGENLIAPHAHWHFLPLSDLIFRRTAVRAVAFFMGLESVYSLGLHLTTSFYCRRCTHRLCGPEEKNGIFADFIAIFGGRHRKADKSWGSQEAVPENG